MMCDVGHPFKGRSLKKSWWAREEILFPKESLLFLLGSDRRTSMAPFHLFSRPLFLSCLNDHFEFRPGVNQ